MDWRIAVELLPYNGCEDRYKQVFKSKGPISSLWRSKMLKNVYQAKLAEGKLDRGVPQTARCMVLCSGRGVGCSQSQVFE